jgi:hypothetical protein
MPSVGGHGPLVTRPEKRDQQVAFLDQRSSTHYASRASAASACAADFDIFVRKSTWGSTTSLRTTATPHCSPVMPGRAQVSTSVKSRGLRGVDQQCDGGGFPARCHRHAHGAGQRQPDRQHRGCATRCRPGRPFTGPDVVSRWVRRRSGAGLGCAGSVWRLRRRRSVAARRA